MKRIRSKVHYILCVLFGCALSSMCGAAPEPGSQLVVPPDIVSNITLFCAVNTNQVEGMEPIILTAVLTNGSTNEVSIRRSSNLFDCAVSVKDAAGGLIPHTRFASKAARDALQVGQRELAIPPQGTHTYRLPLNRLYDMSVPGSYQVSVSTRVFVRISNHTLFLDVESLPVNLDVSRSAEE